MHDVIVVGAGLSGLVCTRRLVEAGSRVLLIDARDRVGGRLHNGEVGDALVDLGGQWITAGQHRVIALAAELGVETREHVRRGVPVFNEPGGLFVKVAAALAQRRAMKTIDAEMAAIARNLDDDLDRDHTTLAAWLEANVPNELARDRLRLHADLVFATEAEDLSLLSYLTTMRATGGFRPTGDDLPGGGREHRFVGGAAALPRALFERIANKPGFDADLAFPVQSVDDSGNSGDSGTTGVTVRGYRGEHRARRVVLAIPPLLVRELAIDLPNAHRAYLDGVRMGGVVKCFAAYDRAFWRDRGLSGEAYLPRGTVRAVVEIAGDPPVLLAFVVGAAAARWASRDPDERRAEILAILTAQFGELAAQPLAYLEQDWVVDRWSGGCVASTRPDVLSRGARWREPHGNVHFAGTETASLWPGYMEGAIEAGERAAAEVLAVLR